MHSFCLEEMLNHTSICRNCRTNRTPQNRGALPVDEQEGQPGNLWFGPGTIVFMLCKQRTVLDEIGSYRGKGLLNLHRPGSPLWNSLLFDISYFILFEYLTYIDDFINEEVGETMYLRGFVVLTVEVSKKVRHCFYDSFLMNIPEVIPGFVNSIRFPFLFHDDAQQTRVTITTKYVLSHGKPVWYPTDVEMCNYFSASTVEQKRCFRDWGRPLKTHNSLTTSLTIVPYPINPINWFTYYILIHSFLDGMYYGTILDNRPILYLHANVYSPLNFQLYPMHRFSIYKMFLFNTPPELKFRFFMSTNAVPHEAMFIEKLSFRKEYSSPRCHNLQCEQ